ncbi:MAG: hypothetical protein GKR98_16320 [Boseongicola sp.]|nr:MAG: hypothetical protein GKR98_16320 [Boseongicola sp.]
MAEVFHHKRGSREPVDITMTALSVLALILLIFFMNLHPIVAAVFAVLISPAVWGVIANTQAEMTIDETQISWKIGQRGASVTIDDIDMVKARTGLDLSQRVTIFRHSGPRLYVPAACIPSGRIFDEELQTRGVKVQRLF